MSIFAGKPPEAQPTTEINPPFKYEQQQHTGQAMPPEPTHTMNDGQMLDMLGSE